MGNPWDNDPIVSGPSGGPAPTAAPAAPAAAPMAAAPAAPAPDAAPWANDPVVPGTGPSSFQQRVGFAPGQGGVVKDTLAGAGATLGNQVDATRLIAMHIGNALGLIPDEQVAAAHEKFAQNKADRQPYMDTTAGTVGHYGTYGAEAIAALPEEALAAGGSVLARGASAVGSMTGATGSAIARAAAPVINTAKWLGPVALAANQIKQLMHSDHPIEEAVKHAAGELTGDH